MNIWSQRDSPDPLLRAHGCVAYSMVNAYQIASGGAVGPTSDQSAAVAAWVRVDRSGATRKQFSERGLTMSEAATSLAAIKRRDERPALKSQLQRGVRVTDLLAQLGSTNGLAIVAVNYGAFQDAGIGVGTFRGGHGIVVLPPSSRTVTIADPLRRATKTIDIDVLVKGMETFGKYPWGNGRGEAVVVWPWSDYRNLMQQARRQRDVYKAEVARLEPLVDEGAIDAAYKRGMADEAMRYSKIEAYTRNP